MRHGPPVPMLLPHGSFGCLCCSVVCMQCAAVMGWGPGLAVNNLYFFSVLKTYFSLCMCVRVHVCRHPRRPEDSVRSLGVEVAGSSEFPDIGARNRTWVLSKSRKCSYLPSRLSNPSL